MVVSNDLVAMLVQRLTTFENSERPSGFPRDRMAAQKPGLYSWWADDTAREALGRPFGLVLPRLIYAGLAGATREGASTPATATLSSRIRGMHLGTNVQFSTFRLTLAAIMREPLGLRLTSPGRLDLDSERELTAWMECHLRVIAVPVDDR
jgi:hypothetical protein